MVTYIENVFGLLFYTVYIVSSIDSLILIRFFLGLDGGGGGGGDGGGGGGAAAASAGGDGGCLHVL